jgi:hypothetical protein
MVRRDVRAYAEIAQVSGETTVAERTLNGHPSEASASHGAMFATTLKGRQEDVLLESDLIADKQFEEARAERRGSGDGLAEKFVSVGAVAARTVADASMPALALYEARLRREDVGPPALALVAEEVGLAQLAAPVRVEGELLQVAVWEPSGDVRVTHARPTGRHVRMMLAPLGDVTRTSTAPTWQSEASRKRWNPSSRSRVR